MVLTPPFVRPISANRPTNVSKKKARRGVPFFQKLTFFENLTVFSGFSVPPQRKKPAAVTRRAKKFPTNFSFWSETPLKKFGDKFGRKSVHMVYGCCLAIINSFFL